MKIFILFAFIAFSANLFAKNNCFENFFSRIIPSKKVNFDNLPPRFFGFNKKVSGILHHTDHLIKIDAVSKLERDFIRFDIEPKYDLSDSQRRKYPTISSSLFYTTEKNSEHMWHLQISTYQEISYSQEAEARFKRLLSNFRELESRGESYSIHENGVVETDSIVYFESKSNKNIFAEDSNGIILFDIPLKSIGISKVLREKGPDRTKPVLTMSIRGTSLEELTLLYKQLSSNEQGSIISYK